jgi:hypothetical protein
VKLELVGSPVECEVISALNVRLIDHRPIQHGGFEEHAVNSSIVAFCAGSKPALGRSDSEDYSPQGTP